MKKPKQIIIVDDDNDDLEIYSLAIKSFGYSYEVVTINDSTKVIGYLKEPGISPLLILSDIDMPTLNGYELHHMITRDSVLSRKRTPFILFSTSGSPESVLEACNSPAQGFFLKENNYDVIKNTLKQIIDYWRGQTSQ